MPSSSPPPSPSPSSSSARSPFFLPPWKMSGVRYWSRDLRAQGVILFSMEGEGARYFFWSNDSDGSGLDGLWRWYIYLVGGGSVSMISCVV